MRDHRDAEDSPHPDVWTGRATNRVQWLMALIGAACMALGIELAVDSAWTSGIAPLAMSVVGCIAAGLLVLFGTLAFVHVDLAVPRVTDDPEGSFQDADGPTPGRSLITIQPGP